MSSDMEGSTGSMLLLCLLCLIGLTNANTSPEINQYLYHVCEDTPIGAIAFTIKATDAENDPLTYSITGANAGYFSVDRNTGAVTVMRQLDREGIGDLMTLDVLVSDGLNETPGTLNLLLNDANDNKPIFLEPSYDITIPENTTVGTSLFRVQATDADTSIAAVVHYSIDEVIPDAGFGLFSIVSTTGEVRLSGSLNYTGLSTFYRLKISATDGGGRCYYDETKFFSSMVFSFIMVEDVPDLDPLFTGVPYIGRVEENAPIGKSVFKVRAIDQDREINDNIMYSIEDSTAPEGLFKISSADGIISVSSEIDRELIGDSVTLTVKATESKPNIHGDYASATANVQIEITDMNDNRPEFYKCGGSGDELSCEKATQFTGEVLEHSLGAVPINMTVKDLDKISHIELTLVGADKDVFSVEPQFIVSGNIVQLLVKQPQKLDFEQKQEMVLQVIAKDQEEPSYQSTATVTIKIKDTYK